jgi:hypothetical protein
MAAMFGINPKMHAHRLGSTQAAWSMSKNGLILFSLSLLDLKKLFGSNKNS